MIGYIISFIIGGLFGSFIMGLIFCSGKQNGFEDAYEQGKQDALFSLIETYKKKGVI